MNQHVGLPTLQGMDPQPFLQKMGWNDTSTSNSNAEGGTNKSTMFDPGPPPIPLNLPSGQETDALLSETFNKLSLAKREEALHDVHGVGDILEETETLRRMKLIELETEIRKIVAKPAYELAWSMSIEYVTRVEFRLKFLRAENFETTKAAIRMVRYFEEKLVLFGQEKLVRDIMLQDLDAETISGLQSGYCQLLPQRDTAGRPIIFTNRSLMPNISLDARMHILWYLIESLLEDEESQRKGAVIVYYCLEKVNPVVPKARVKNSGKTNTNRIVYTCCHAMPLKIASVHGCNNDPRLQPFFDFALFVMANTTRVRFRFHAGTHIETQYKLMTFGIPKVAIPVDTEGNPDIKNHSVWLRQRYQREQLLLRMLQQQRHNGAVLPAAYPSPPAASCYGSGGIGTGNGGGSNNAIRMPMGRGIPITTMAFANGAAATSATAAATAARSAVPATTSNNDMMFNPVAMASATATTAVLDEATADKEVSTIVVPRRVDVLMGRGKLIEENGGNLRLRHLIATHGKRYDEATKFEKTVVAKTLLKMIHETGGRFLKRNEAGWYIVSDDMARDKISHAFRNRRNRGGGGGSGSSGKGTTSASAGGSKKGSTVTTRTGPTTASFYSFPAGNHPTRPTSVGSSARTNTDNNKKKSSSSSSSSCPATNITTAPYKNSIPIKRARRS